VRIPRWVGLAFVVGVILIIDLFSKSVSTTMDGGIRIERDEFTWVDATVLALAFGVGVPILVVRWWTFRWWIENGAIWTRGGILHKWKRRVELEQIVVIDRTSTPVRRIFGVSRIAIETTAIGQAAPDILLGYLSNRDANRLEDLLIAKLVFDDSDGKANRFTPIGVDRLGWWELFLASAMTIQLTRALVVLWVISQFLGDSTSASFEIESDDTVFGLTPVLSFVVQLLGVVAVLWLASTLYFVVSFARFRLGKHEGWLIIETGVIRRTRRLIKAEAIQGLEIFRSPLQRLFRNKRAMLRMRLPAYGAPSYYAMVLHPAVTDAALPSLTNQVAAMDAATSAAMCGKGVHRLAVGCRNAYILYWPIRIAAVSAMVLVLLLTINRDLWWWALIPAGLVVPFALRGYLAWKCAGWYAEHGDWLLIQRGVLGLTSTAARPDQIQYLAWSQGLFSRPNAVLSMAISVPTSGGAGIVSQILALLHRPVDPSIIRVRAMEASDARRIAMLSGFERSLPPGIVGS
jgi:uncharacterized membrane protein YdbT with pleckstrin-like domain